MFKQTKKYIGYLTVSIITVLICSCILYYFLSKKLLIEIPMDETLFKHDNKLSSILHGDIKKDRVLKIEGEGAYATNYITDYRKDFLKLINRNLGHTLRLEFEVMCNEIDSTYIFINIQHNGKSLEGFDGYTRKNKKINKWEKIIWRHKILQNIDHLNIQIRNDKGGIALFRNLNLSYYTYDIKK